MKFWALLGLIFTLALGGVASAQVDIGTWRVEFDGQNTCMMTSEYNAGNGFQAAVSIGVFQGGTAVAFVSERWQMTPGETANIRMRVDNIWDQRVNVEAKDAQTLLVLFTQSGGLLEAIARGNRIYLHDGNEGWNFTLHGTARAIPNLMACARRHVY